MRAMQPEEYAARYDERHNHSGFATALELGHNFFFKKHTFTRELPAVSHPTLLDIGTSTGLFVHACAEHGINAIGIDTDASAISIGKQLFSAAQLFRKELGEVAAEGKQFDFVTLFEVLEHVENPRQLVETAKRLVRPGGKLVVFVPNRKRTPVLYKEMVDRGDDVPPHHLTKWSKPSLQYVFEHAGLKDILMRDIGKYHFPFLPSLGIATRVGKDVVSGSSGDASVVAGAPVYNEAARKKYASLSNLKTLADNILFFWVDAWYKLRGYERDGLYAEATAL